MCDKIDVDTTSQVVEIDPVFELHVISSIIDGDTFSQVSKHTTRQHGGPESLMELMAIDVCKWDTKDHGGAYHHLVVKE